MPVTQRGLLCDTPSVYDRVKAAQAAAVLLSKAPGHRLSRLKLMKLMYLADRRAFAHRGSTISGDRLVAMPHGPVLSRTLGALKMEDAAPADWLDWVTWINGNDYQLADHADITNAGRLSQADLDDLASTWDEFGSMTAWQLREWTHDSRNCPEYHDPHGSSMPIDMIELALAVGLTRDEAEAALAQQEEADSIDRALAAL